MSTSALSSLLSAASFVERAATRVDNHGRAVGVRAASCMVCAARSAAAVRPNPRQPSAAACRVILWGLASDANPRPDLRAARWANSPPCPRWLQEGKKYTERTSSHTSSRTGAAARFPPSALLQRRHARVRCAGSAALLALVHHTRSKARVPASCRFCCLPLPAVAGLVRSLTSRPRSRAAAPAPPPPHCLALHLHPRVARP